MLRSGLRCGIINWTSLQSSAPSALPTQICPSISDHSGGSAPAHLAIVLGMKIPCPQVGVRNSCLLACVRAATVAQVLGPHAWSWPALAPSTHRTFVLQPTFANSQALPAAQTFQVAASHCPALQGGCLCAQVKVWGCTYAIVPKGKVKTWRHVRWERMGK